MLNGWLMEGFFYIEIKRVWGIRVIFKVIVVDEKLFFKYYRKIGRD